MLFESLAVCVCVWMMTSSECLDFYFFVHIETDQLMDHTEVREGQLMWLDIVMALKQLDKIRTQFHPVISEFM